MRPKSISTQTSERKKTAGIGRLGFSKKTERSLFFFLTVAMLVMGFLAKAGIW